VQLSGRPILPTRVDQSLYVARDADMRVQQALGQGLNVLVLGDAGSGKTSLVRHVEYALRDAGTTVSYVDGRQAGTAAELLDRVRSGLAIERPNDGSVAEMVSVATGQGLPAPSAQRSLAHLARMLPPDQRAVVLVDSPDQVVAHKLFGQLRDVVWQVPASWVVAADSAVEPELRRPPADAFFDLVERLGTFRFNESIDVLERRGLSRDQARDVVTGTDGAPSGGVTPRVLLERARLLALEQSSPAELRTSEAAFQDLLGQVSRAAAMLAAEIRGTGAVSASDEQLQRRMGWTRNRLTQVLRELEGAGLARASQSSDGRTGRPRRFYEITEP
jgi:Cdc6-like AAA superfamily ATPase